MWVWKSLLLGVCVWVGGFVRTGFRGRAGVPVVVCLKDVALSEGTSGTVGGENKTKTHTYTCISGWL